MSSTADSVERSAADDDSKSGGPWKGSSQRPWIRGLHIRFLGEGPNSTSIYSALVCAGKSQFQWDYHSIVFFKILVRSL